MDAASFNRDIRRAWNFVRDELDTGQTVANLSSLRTDELFRDAALSADRTYADIYRVGLSRSFYNILLLDYSYFQFSWRSQRAWRLAYYPNPWLAGAPDAQERLRHWESLEEAGALSYEDVGLLIDELPYWHAIPPIRFEYASDQYRELIHPAAHFHIGRDTENRWASNVVFGPLTFTMMTMRLYYYDAWRSRSSFEGGPEDDCVEQRFIRALGSSSVVHQFSDLERRCIHFGRGA